MIITTKLERRLIKKGFKCPRQDNMWQKIIDNYFVYTVILDIRNKKVIDGFVSIWATRKVLKEREFPSEYENLKQMIKDVER